MKIEIIRMYLNCPKDILLLNFIYNDSKEKHILTDFISEQSIPNYEIDLGTNTRDSYIEDDATNSIMLYASVGLFEILGSYLNMRGINVNEECFFRDEIIHVQYNNEYTITRGTYNCITNSITGFDGESACRLYRVLSALTRFGYRMDCWSEAKVTAKDLYLLEFSDKNSTSITGTCTLCFNIPSIKTRIDILNIYGEVYGKVSEGAKMPNSGHLELTCKLDKLEEFMKKLESEHLVNKSYDYLVSSSLFIQYVTKSDKVHDGVYNDKGGKLLDIPDEYRLSVLNIVKELKDSVTRCFDIPSII